MKLIKKLLFMTIFLCLFFSYQVYADSPPSIVGKSAITMDVATGEMIYTKNIDDRMFPASTTKLMTALILAENKKPEDMFTYSQKAKLQESFSINYNVKPITVNDKISASEAMDAMLIGSANDIAYMIAENVGNGNCSNFIDMMNKKAAELKLKNTHFVSPNGLHDDNHYTSAYDLSVIARQDYKYPWIMNTIVKKNGVLHLKNNVLAEFDNKNKLINDPGCVGGKTGYTGQAGRCLVEYYEINNRKIVGVVLKSDYDKDDKTVFEDMKKIIDWSYAAKKENYINKDTSLKKISLSYHLLPFNIGPKKTAHFSVSTKTDVKKYNNSDVYNTNFTINTKNPWKLKKDNAVGYVTVTSRETKNKYDVYPSISKSKLIKSNIIFYIAILAIIIGILVIIVFQIKKRNKKKNNSFYRRVY